MRVSIRKEIRKKKLAEKAADKTRSKQAKMGHSKVTFVVAKRFCARPAADGRACGALLKTVRLFRTTGRARHVPWCEKCQAESGKE